MKYIEITNIDETTITKLNEKSNNLHMTRNKYCINLKWRIKTTVINQNFLVRTENLTEKLLKAIIDNSKTVEVVQSYDY